MPSWTTHTPNWCTASVQRSWEGLVAMTTYRVEVRRGERWWVLSVPQISAAHSQARHLREVEQVARDLIAILLDASADSFEVDVHIELPAAVAEHLQRAERLRREAALAQNEAAAEFRAAARELVDQGLPLRDVGRALGVSYQRAHQLVSTPAA